MSLNANVKSSLIFQASKQCRFGRVQHAWMYNKGEPLINYGRHATVYNLTEPFDNNRAVIKVLPRLSIGRKTEIDYLRIVGQFLALGCERGLGGRCFIVMKYMGEPSGPFWGKGALQKEAKKRYLHKYEMERRPRDHLLKSDYRSHYVYHKNDLGKWQAEIVDWSKGIYKGNYILTMKILNNMHPFETEYFCGG